MTHDQHDGPPPPAPEVRDGNGRPIRTAAQVERDAWAAEQRGLGRSYRTIAADLGISVGSCHAAVRRAFKDIAEPLVAEARAAELAVLEGARDAALDVLQRKHVTISYGQIMKGEDGKPLLDDGPILQAAQTVARVSSTIHDLMGWKSASKVQLSGEVTYQLVGVDPEALS